MLSLLLSLSVVALQPSAALAFQTQGGTPPSPSTTQSPPPAGAPARPQAPGAAAAPAGDTPRDLLIGAQDSIKVFVFEEPLLSNSYKIGQDGAFDYPYIGRVVAIGKTARQLEEEITRRLSDGYVRKPQVTIEVETLRSRFVFVSGEVRTAGKIPLSNQMTLLEALIGAGYVGPSAGTSVLVTRQPEQPALPGAGTARTKSYPLAGVQNGQSDVNILLYEGDSIVVPRAEKIYITGYVKTPGAFAHEAGMTVLQALSLAGGVDTSKGSTRGIKIVRRVNGKEVEISVGMSDLVQPGDTIKVRQRLL